MRIAEGLHLAMSGGLGLDLTDSLDCNAYLICAGSEWIMFDAGAGRSIPETLALIEADGVDLSTIRYLFLTHGHPDHSGGAASLREKLGLRVHAGAATARMVSTADKTAISLDVARSAGIYPSDYTDRGCAVDQLISDGDVLSFGDTRVTAIATPGHSHDHLSFLVKRSGCSLLISGDALFHGGRISLQNIHDCSVPESCRSIARLAALKFNILLPGHGLFSLRNGDRHVATAMKSIERLLCPPGLG